jgi:hypothetical protein
MALTVLALLATAGCGSDPQEPQEVETQITVQLDWPLARDPGFVNARWRAYRRDVVPDSFAYKQTKIDEGQFGSDGTASAQFTASCVPDRDLNPFYAMDVVGHFTAYELPEAPDESDYWCRLNVYGPDLAELYCTEDPQVGEIQPPLVPRQVCTPPDS